jgi:hypothetical protein
MKKYEILDKLGQGGMGVVYKAVQKNLNREVAIKILPKAYSENPEVKQRFISEMQICGGLLHPNIIRIFDSGEQDGTLYYVMEYLKGTTVLDLVQQKGPVPVNEALKLTADMLEAMKYYHPMGLVHRDIKPANIMVKAEPLEAVLMDFGLVKALYASGITIQGRLVGTPRYMSPEMLRGQLVDCRSDIFQLGLVFYEMLAGVPAFRGKDRAEVTRKLLEEDPEKASQLNPLVTVPVENLIANAIDKNADNRYPSAEAFLEDLNALREGSKVFRRTGARPIKTLGTSKALEPLPTESAPELVSVESGRTPAADVSLQDLRPALRSLAWKLAAAAVVLLVVVAGLVLHGGRVVYSARELEAKVDFGETRIRWQSDQTYPTQVEYGESESLFRVVSAADEEAGSTLHEVVLKGLSEGTQYRYRILYPDRTQSAIHEFTTPQLTFTAVSVKRTGLTEIEVDAQTSAAVRSCLEFKVGSQSGRVDGPATEGRSHRFTFDRLGTDAPASVRVIALGTGGSEKGSDWLEVPGPIGLARECAAAIRRLPLKDWVVRAERALAARTDSRQVARQLDEQWKAEPASRQVQAFQDIAPLFFQSKEVPASVKADAYHALAILFNLNHYCSVRRVPFHIGVEDCLPESFSPSTQPRVQTREIYKQDIRNPFGFTPLGLIGARPAPTQEGAAASVEETVLVKLEKAGEIREAELLLAAEVKDPMAVFSVQLNGRLTLAFRLPDSAQNRRFIAVYHTFDPRFLQEGENKLTLSLGSIAGYAMADSSQVKFLAVLVKRP